MTQEAKEKLVKILDEKIRPQLRADGGDVELVEVTDDGVARLRLTGACSGCPFASMTLAITVEQALKKEIPELVRIEPVS